MFGSTLGNVCGLLYFLYFQLAGICIMTTYLKKEGPFTKLLLGSVTGSILLQWLPALFALVFDFGMTAHILAAILTLFTFLPAFRSRAYLKERITETPSRVRYHGGFFCLLGLTMILWIYLLHTHTIPLYEDGSIYTGQCTYGDMNMHLGFITSIANQGAFPPDYSLFPGTKLSYPFLADSNSSSIYLMGASLRFAYILPMLVALPQIIGGVYLLSMTLFRSRAKALLTYALYIFNGGLGFFYFIDWAREREFTFESIFTGFYTTPTNLVDHNIRWVNLIADMFLPQRATLFGYAILIPAIWLLHQAVFGNKKRYFLPAGIFVSALPMVHTHSFLGMGLVSASWLLVVLYRGVVPEEKRKLPVGPIFAGFVVFMCILQMLSSKDFLQEEHFFFLGIFGIGLCVLYGIWLLIGFLRKNGYQELLTTWGVFLGCVLLLAVPQLLFWTFGHVIGNSNMVRGHFNWGNQGDFYPWFYLKNLGLPLVLGIGAICANKKRSSHLLLPIFVIWFVIELIVFQPNVYDNNKLLYIAYLLLCLIAADYGVELYGKLKEIGGAKWLAGSFLFFSLLSGVLTLGREAVSEYQLYNASYVNMAVFIEENTPVDAVILTQTRHNNEIPSLTGRNIVCGADTFLYFHGIDTTERRAELQRMYEEPATNLDLYEKYHVSYVAVTNWERSSYVVDEAAMAELFELIYDQDNSRLYRVP